MSEPKDRAIELGGAASVIVILAVTLGLIGGGAAGWSSAGPLGGLLGTLLGAAFGVLVFTLVRLAATSKRLRERAAPDLRALPAEQALQILGAIMASSSSGSSAQPSVPSLASGLLGELAIVRRMAEQGEREGALAKLDALRESNPRAPAIPAERARVLRASSREREARSAVRSAIELALHGGMNRLAAQVFVEFVELDQTEPLELDAATRSRLALALAAQGDHAAAQRCQAASVSPPA
ncbi:hypothetical protein ACNOYE_29425 [Nannocystaceae bacterium ST9]